MWKKDSSIAPFFGLFWDNALLMRSPHFYLFTTQRLQLDTRTKYDYMNASDGVPGCAMNQERHVQMMNGGFATNTMSTT